MAATVEVPQLLTTEEVAQLIAMSPEFVREHAAELGGLRVGRGPRAQLRFDPAGVVAWIEARKLAAEPEAPTPIRRRRKSQVPPDLELIPVPAWAASPGSG